MKKKPTPIEQFLSLSDAQKDAEVDRVLSLPPSAWRPLTPAERKQFETWQKKAKANFRKRNAGRPVIGKGAQVISLTVERDLLARADRYAKARDLTRAALVALGLELAMKRASST